MLDLISWYLLGVRANSKYLEEDYPSAKVLKLLVDILRQASVEVNRLEMIKSRAVKDEDFDSATAVKHEIDDFRLALISKIHQDGFDFDAHGDFVRSPTFPVYAPSYSRSHSSQLPPPLHSSSSSNQHAIRWASTESVRAVLVGSGLGVEQIFSPTKASHYESADLIVEHLTDSEGATGHLATSSSSLRALEVISPVKKHPSTQKTAHSTASSMASALDERPIKPTSQSLQIDEFDENSVPPGLSPARSNPLPPQPSRLREKKANAAQASTTQQQSRSSLTGTSAHPDSLSLHPSSTDPKRVVKRVKKKAVESGAERHAAASLPPFKRPDAHVVPQFEVEEMNDAMKFEFTEMIAVFGEYPTACALSNQFAARAWGIEEARRNFKNPPPSSADAIIMAAKACLQLAIKTLSDSRDKIVLPTVALIGEVMGFCFLTS